ncbi:MAG: ATP-dependent Clp protease ATP-binding subunit [Thermotogaceae bacterium]|nr:ATP-dependent Clp protease ATP-binding subunit [Thermotogaceae bacterium]
MINYEEYTEKAKKILMDVQDILMRYRQNQLASEHILLSMLEDGDNIAIEILNEKNISIDSLKKDVEEVIGRYGSSRESTNQIYITPEARHILENARSEARRMHDSKTGTEHILLAMVRETSAVASRLLAKYGINLDNIYTLILKGRTKSGAEEDENLSSLKKFTIDLTQLAKEGKLMPVIGREDEVRRVIQIVGRKTKNNPALVGEPGVGKTAIVEGLAQRIVSGDIPEYLNNKSVLALDMGRLVAGTKFRGEFEERMKDIIDSVRRLSGEVILFIDEIHSVVGAGSAEGSMDAANLLKPALARGELQCIGATTLDEYRKYIEKDRALERRFQPVVVDQPTPEETYEILEGLKSTYEKHHEIKIEDDALRTAVDLSVKYITDRYLPDKAIDLVDEAASFVRLRTGYMPEKLRLIDRQIKDLDSQITSLAEKGEYQAAAELKMEAERKNEDFQEEKRKWESDESFGKAVTPAVVASIVEQWTGIPAGKMLQSEREKLRDLESIIHERFMDQEEAVKTVSQTIRRARAGLNAPHRPWGSFLFVGPTGVGKTELAKSLAFILFGSEDAMIRIDMSEYMEKHAVSRLIGAPPGYVGYEEGGQLTEAVRRRPYSVILLDEVEKAHKEVHNVLLQIMDDGRLTDGKGKTVSFSNTIVIMTSNVASEQIATIADKEQVHAVVEEGLRSAFRPEFINRLDSVVLFRPLDGRAMEGIVKMRISEMERRLSEQRISVEISQEALGYLAKEGYDREYGARPVRRLIEKSVEGPIADMIIDGSLEEGMKVIIDSDNSEILIRAEKGSER